MGIVSHLRSKSDRIPVYTIYNPPFLYFLTRFFSITFRLKTLLFVLLRAFEFKLAVPASEIGSRTLLVRRPVLLSHPDKENQMPLFVTPYMHEN